MNDCKIPRPVRRQHVTKDQKIVIMLFELLTWLLKDEHLLELNYYYFKELQSSESFLLRY